MLLLNVDSLQMAAIVLFLFLLNKRPSEIFTFAATILLGLAFTFKPNIVFAIIMLFVFWIVNRQFKTFLLAGFGFFVGMISAVLMASFYFGSMQIWLQWPSRLKLFVDHARFTPENYAFAKLILESYGVDISFVLAITLLCVCCGIMWIRRGTAEMLSANDKSPSQVHKDFVIGELPVISLGLMIYIISAPVVWEHYYIYTIPVMLVGMSSLGGPKENAGYKSAIQRILVVAAFCFLSIPNLANMPEDREASYWINSGMVILFLIALWQIWQIKNRNQIGEAVSAIV